MRSRQAAVIGQNAVAIQGFGARYGRARKGARGNALSYTGRTLVLHEKSACPTRMFSLSYTEKRIFPLHGAEGVTQGNSTDPLRFTNAAKCQTGQGGDNCTKWFLAIIAIIKTPFAMLSRQAAVIGQSAPAIQGFGARGRHSALTWLFGRPNRKQGKNRGFSRPNAQYLPKSGVFAHRWSPSKGDLASTKGLQTGYNAAEGRNVYL